MADTIRVNLSNIVWTEVSASGSQGFITNASSDTVIYVESSSLPAADSTDGHRLNPGEDISYSISGSQKVYAKGRGPTARVMVTPSASFFPAGNVSSSSSVVEKNTPADSVYLDGFSGSSDLHIPATPGLRYCGVSIRETAGSAGPMTFRALRGAIANNDRLCNIELPADSSRPHWLGDSGVKAEEGISLVVSTGVADVTLYYKILAF